MIFTNPQYIDLPGAPTIDSSSVPQTPVGPPAVPQARPQAAQLWAPWLCPQGLRGPGLAAPAAGKAGLWCPPCWLVDY